MPHNDLQVQLEVVEPWGGYDPGLWTGADGGDQEDSKHGDGRIRFLTDQGTHTGRLII